MQKWKDFLASGTLYEPSPNQRPLAFFCDDKSFSLLKETINNLNRDNWYAHYLLGVRYFIINEYCKAECEWKTSIELAQNPWAFHGLACVARITNHEKESICYMLKGMTFKMHDCSYLKEGFRQVYRCRGYQELVDFYERLSDVERRISRLKFFYISSLHKLGSDLKAFEILEENGGLDMEDIRKGEDSIMQLWSELYENVNGKKGDIPYKYRFKLFVQNNQNE